MSFLFNVEKFKNQYKHCRANELSWLNHSIKIAKFNMYIAGICNTVIGLYYILFMHVWYVLVVSAVVVMLIAYTIYIANKMITSINELLQE